MIHATAFAHKLAVIDETATIGPYCKVWQFASVIRGSVLGDLCSVASCAIVDGARLGNCCIVSHGAFVDPGIKIGHGVFIGPHVSLCNDAWPRVGKTGFEIDKLINGSFITTVIEDDASLGANVVVLPGIVIGEGAMVAAGAVVDRDVPGHHIFKRDGGLAKIDQGRDPRRMRRAGG